LSSTKKNDWFATWFDSKYYHILYNNRNDAEAANFLNNIISFLKIKHKQSILDLACGKGRHSKFLANKNFDVVGCDLSENSINYAKQFESDNLKFAVKDMRDFKFENQFDYVFNLFTSFGYFDDVKDNIATLNAINQNLKPKGILMIDFLNAIKVQLDLINREVVKRNELLFNIERKVENGNVVKTINFKADDNNFSFEEKVQLLSLNGFEQMLEATGFKILQTFGNYDLHNYSSQTSDRLILIAEKI